MQKLYPSTAIPSQDDEKGWKEITLILKKIEKRHLDNKKSIQAWKAQDVKRRRDRLANLRHASTSSQELKYLDWKSKRLDEESQNI